MFQQAFQGIRTVFAERSSWRIALAGSVGIAILLYWLLAKVTTLPTFFAMAQGGEFGAHSILYATLYWSMTLATVVLFGISVAVLVWLWRHSKLSRALGGSGAAGAFIGALGSACPVCGAFLLSLLGASGGVAMLPLQGLELKFVSLGLIASTAVFGARRVGIQEQEHCDACEALTAGAAPDHSPHPVKNEARSNAAARILPLEKIFIPLLIVLFSVNQLFISRTAAMYGMTSGGIASIFAVKTAVAATVIAPKLNPDGRTTSLVEQPTITEVPANPNTGDAVVDAKAVVFPTGKPFYAPDDISFDDPINAQNKWGAYENSISLSGDLEARYQQLTNTFTCNYCCGGPTNVTVVARCGCRHAKAWRGMFKYMLQTYGDQYTNEQLMGEAYRWTGIWYPKGVLEDYLLATGKGDAMGHQTHGGAGSDGRHGL